MPVAHIILTSMDIITGGITTRLPIMCTLVRDEDHLILFDTGYWGNRDIADALGRLDLRPDDVTHVFLTHFHGDHAGGSDLFGGAVKIASKKESDFSRVWLRGFADAADRGRYIKEHFPYLDDLIVQDRARMLSAHLALVPQYWWEDKMDGFVWLEDDPDLPSRVEPLPTPGHTPHHTSYLVRGDRGTILVAGDAMCRRASGPEVVILDEPHVDLEAYRKTLATLRSIPALAIPAHDRPFVQGDCPIRMGRRVEF